MQEFDPTHAAGDPDGADQAEPEAQPEIHEADETAQDAVAETESGNRPKLPCP